jgi:hypothetical protein
VGPDREFKSRPDVTVVARELVYVPVGATLVVSEDKPKYTELETPKDIVARCRSEVLCIW